MRILDRYLVRQVLPVWLWCLMVFISLSCLIDFFGQLDEILRYQVPAKTVFQYYLNFAPLVFVRASPMALLFAVAFIATRLARYQEFLAMNASGTSLLRASLPFLFVGWLGSLCVFLVNDRLVPQSMATYQRIRQEAFRGHPEDGVDNVAVMDNFNRLYHARKLDLQNHELSDLTILEHDWQNRPTKNLYASRAIWTKHGWLVLYGRIYRVGPGGQIQGEPEQFVERLLSYPVTPETFIQPEARPETMPYGQLRLLIARFRNLGMNNLKRYRAELLAKLTLPVMNLIVCLLGFAGSTQPQLRGHLRGLGMSLGWGLVYYVVVAIAQGLAKQVPIILVPLTMWAPHVAAVWWSLRVLRKVQ